MSFLRFTAVLGLAGACACAGAEDNLWPFRVAQTTSEGAVVSWQSAGPLLYEKPSASGGTVEGLRPFFARWYAPAGELQEVNVLYPLFMYRTDGASYRWSVFQLMNRSGEHAPAAGELPTITRHETFDVWPIWFSRTTGQPESSYRALFPIAGRLRSRFGYDELSWTLFPLYGRAEKSGAVSTSTPWPFVKTTRGTEQGFALWPLFGHREKPGEFERSFYVWPLIWNNTIQPADADAGAAPRREVGVLPFYTSETSAGFVNRSYLWPFFGYTDRTAPARYHEARYFWPFLVQGRGDDRYVNRWGPVYTHSVVKGVDKQWYLWPVYRERRWSDASLQHTQRQVLYFLYRSTEQRSATNLSAAPASKAHLWPLVSTWDNGAGRKQVQFPSPLEVFFPDNERVRVSWSPLFALYRYDQTAPDTRSHEALWGLFTSRTAPGEREIHLGPLFSLDARDGAKRIAFGNGLLGWRRAAGGRWGFFWFDFPDKANNLRASAR